MIDTKTTSRIIGDCLEINADIVSYRFNSKLPIFIKRFIVNRKYQRIINFLKKFHKSEYVLTIENLSEFFIYVFNNYPPYGNYRSVEAVTSKTVEFGKQQLETKISFDNIICWILIEEEKETFDINIREIGKDESRTGCSISTNKLYSSNPNIQPLLHKVNEELRNNIYHYILDIILSYRKIV